MKRRVGILFSGRGSNMLALVAAARRADFPAEVALALCNEPHASGIAAARAAGVATAVVDHRPFRGDRAAHEAAMAAALEAAGVGFVCLAGYMRLLTPFLVNRYARRMLNIHPSLLPAFPGLDTHARAIAGGARLHGCTVHWVSDVMDAGPVVAQAAAPVLAGDTPEILAARVLAQEHALYPAALARALLATPLPATGPVL